MIDVDLQRHHPTLAWQAQPAVARQEEEEEEEWTERRGGGCIRGGSVLNDTIEEGPRRSWNLEQCLLFICEICLPCVLCSV